MSIGFLEAVFREAPEAGAIVDRGQVYTYGWLLEEIGRWKTRLSEEGVSGVVALESDFSAKAIAALLALVDRGCTVVPLTSTVGAQKPEFREIAQIGFRIVAHSEGSFETVETGRALDHPHLLRLAELGHPGLVLFSSGSTGKSKAAVHDFAPLLEKFHVRKRSFRTLSFLLFDHIGGVNTLLYTLSNGGLLVTVEDRSPDSVCAAIARHGVQLLPTSPTFLNLLLFSEAHTRHDLSSLTLITYGTEPMPPATLTRLSALFPEIRLQQTYGLSELGILRSKSKASDSLWVKIGGEGFETRVVDGLLEIRARSAMLGYLNAPSPFTADGWFKTGDAVEVDGEFFRILGRRSEIINVGGEKVYPAEVEGILQLMSGVEDVTVRGEKNPITGQIVTARVRLTTEETAREFRKRMRVHCRDRLAGFKVPQRVALAEHGLHGDRFKKQRGGP